MGRQAPQRSLSSTNAIQRPTPHRTLSQQFSSSSPTRRGSDNFVDLTSDGDAAQARPRIGTSRLRVEISTDSNPSDNVYESPKPSSASTPTWKPSLPPRGRPQLPFDTLGISNLSPRPAQDGSQNELVIKPMPLPVRPGKHAPPTSEKARSSTANTLKKDARPRPYVLETPTAAPRYSPNGHADFYPWTGNHPEDQFSDSVIRQGYYDKAQMTQNETGSAKATIFPALKHKSGLQTLSSLFTSVLAQRRAHGQITSASTFKPPPRVTVTDTKREMWLKDLANPTISLRRLSRSIPHGIRGKVLLDQSLSKNIPIERAVWLAKCVGANELRSFRRKGVSGTFAMGGGEAKWIRDFTVCVEQFVESIIGTCGEKDFKTRINYAVRLATYFHAEYLLDREHYMDWLVSSLENCPQPKVPMWLLITQIYWKDLLQYRKYGRRLSAALLHHLAETLIHPDRDILAPLSDRLKTLLKGLMMSKRENFIAPICWAKYRDVMMSNLGIEDDQFMAVLIAIDRRNSQLTITGTKKEASPRRRLIQILDEARSKFFLNELSKQCWEVDEDKMMLMRAILEWSTSCHRPGTTKIYIAARIIRSWSKYGVDVTGAILSFLDSNNCDTSRNKPALYHLVSELARSDHFSTPRYLQWLIARGGLYSPADVARDGPCATRLLAELPTHNISENIVDLRATLLGRVDFMVGEEDERLRESMLSINRKLPGMQGNGDMDVDSDEPPNLGSGSDLISKMSRTSKSELGLWLRQKVKLQMVQPTIPPLHDWDDSPMKGGTSAISSSEFSTIRRYLESIDDFSMLADIVKIVTSSNDPEVLASCADTLDLHIETFSAIGALKGLFDILMGRLRALTADADFVPRVFLVSLSGLASRIPEQKLVAQQLAKELALSDRKTAADACSPVSDHMAIVETAEADFTDEIEKVLASGNSMDTATLERLFQRIILRLEASWEKLPEQQRSFDLLLIRLRTFDIQHFDVLMAEWVKRVLQLQNRPSMMQIFGLLTSFGCVSLQNIILSCNFPDDRGKAQTSKTATLATELLALLLSTSDLPRAMSTEEAYRFQIKQAHLGKDFPLEMLSVVCKAFEHQDHACKSAAENLLKSAMMHELLQNQSLSNPEMLIQKLIMPLLSGPNAEAIDTVDACVDKLLLPSGSHTTITTEMLLDLADDLSLPFCQVKLAAMFRSEDTMMKGTEDSRSQRLEAFDAAIESAIASGSTAWASIVPLLDISIAQHLRRRAESQFLALFPSPRTANGDSLRIRNAENLLHVIEATAYSIPTTNPTVPNQPSLAPEIVTTLNGIWLLLSNTQSQEMKDAIISKWLPLLLSFTAIHAFGFESTKAGNESRAKTILALAAIFLQLQAFESRTEAINALVERTFDLALHLVDSLPEDVRQQCIRSLRDTASNARVSYLFSYSPNPTEWLVLSQKERLPLLPGATAGAGAAERERLEREGEREKLVPFPLRRWEMLGEPTPNVGENDTSLSLRLFGARRG